MSIRSALMFFTCICLRATAKPTLSCWIWSMAFYTTEYAQFPSGAQTATVRWFAESAHVLQPTRPPILHWLNCSGYLIQANGTPLLRLPKPAERSKFDSGMHPWVKTSLYQRPVKEVKKGYVDQTDDSPRCATVLIYVSHTKKNSKIWNSSSPRLRRTSCDTICEQMQQLKPS